jgi:hypothetical protein
MAAGQRHSQARVCTAVTCGAQHAPRGRAAPRRERGEEGSRECARVRWAQRALVPDLPRARRCARGHGGQRCGRRGAGGRASGQPGGVAAPREQQRHAVAATGACVADWRHHRDVAVSASHQLLGLGRLGSGPGVHRAAPHHVRRALRVAVGASLVPSCMTLRPFSPAGRFTRSWSRCAVRARSATRPWCAAAARTRAARV